MKKNIIAFFILLIILNITKAQNRIVVDSIKYVIGNSLKLSTEYIQVYNSGNMNVRINILKGDESEVTLTPGNYRIIYTRDGVLGITGLPKRRAILKIDYDLGFDIIDSSVYYLKIKANVPFSLDGGTEVYDSYWLIKPKYPVLTPILMDTLYCGNNASFNFAALGLDEDTLYSYEIIDDSTGQIINGRGSVVVLDSLINNKLHFNHSLSIKGFYRYEPFKYKYTSKEDRIIPSEWNTRILGPQPRHLEPPVIEYREEDGDKILYLSFKYKVGDKEYPSIINGNEKYSVYNETLKRELLTVSVRGGTMLIKQYPTYIGNLLVEFTDQYNEIKYPIPIKE